MPPAQPLSLGFSSLEVFWSQVDVYVTGYPHQMQSWREIIPADASLSLDVLEGFQAELFERSLGRVDLSDCLAWQRQFRLLDRSPTVLSPASLLGRFQSLPESRQKALLDLADFYLRKKPEMEEGEDPSTFVRRRLAQLKKERTEEKIALEIRASGILGRTGSDLTVLALQVRHGRALLDCDYPEALLSAFWLFGYQEGRNGGRLPDDLHKNLILPVAYANAADALSKGHLDRASSIIGYSLASIPGLHQSRFLEINAWFADVMKKSLEGLGYEELKEQVLLPWQLSQPDQFRNALLGVGLAILFNDPARYDEFWPLLARDFPA